MGEIEDRGLDGLEIYKLSADLSRLIWEIYQGLSKEFQFNTGSQFLEAVDSVGANIAEGFGRYHYKDSLKFYYNSRGSLLESKHWLALLHERKLVSEEIYNKTFGKIEVLGKKLNNFITTLKKKSET